MKTFTISSDNLATIQEILNQYGWPVKDDYNSRLYNDLNPQVIKDIIMLINEKINSDDSEFSSIEYFGLIRVLDFFLLRMWVYEFWTVTWLDFYKNGILLIDDLRYKFYRNE